MAFQRNGLPPAETLHDLFDRYSIELHEMPIPGRQHGGSRSKIYCPDCHGGREKERNFFVKVDRDGMGATWHCFRANNCGFSGGERLKGAPERPQRAPKHHRRPKPESRPQVPDSLISYFEEFGISGATVGALKIYRTERRMPMVDRDGKEQDRAVRELRPVIAYPYYDDGELLNVKYKAVYRRGGKLVKRFSQEYGARPSLFNIDSFENDEWGIFVEGEDDVAALYEAGWRQVTTLVDGSPSKIKPEKEFDRDLDDDGRYVALYGEPRIEQLKKVYLAGDMDEAGVRHMEEIARRVGKGRCWSVRWPGQCKDAKQTLKERGLLAVNHAIETAMPYPLEGVHMPTDEEMANLRAGRVEKRIITGHKAIDDRLCLSDEGQLIITTGISGRGKTTFWNGMSVLYAERGIEEMKFDRLARLFHTVICSPEMKVADMTARLISQRSNLPFWDNATCSGVTMDQMLDEHLPWVRRHYTFIRWPDRSTQPPISWLIERVRENVIRTGAKLAIVDPWQEFDDEMPNLERNHSRHVGRVLQRLLGLALELRVNIVLVVHPTKLKRDKDGKLQIPEGNEIADSVHFQSRCDIGITIHRANDQLDDMLLRVWKAKNSRFARYGDTVLRVDQDTHRIWPKPVEVGAGQSWRPHWANAD